MFASINIVSVGLTALVSRYVGGGEPERAAGIARQGMWLALFLGFLFMVFGFSYAEVLLTFMGTEEGTKQLALPYLEIFFLSAPFFALYDSVSAVFRAAGNTRTPMIVGVSTICLNMVLDPLLIFGIGPFPRLGVPGASVATTISIGTACVVILVMLHRGRAGIKLERPFGDRPKASELLRIAKIGLPITVQQLTFIVVYWFLIRIVHQYGQAAGAAMGIGNRMESISYMTCTGFSMAASTMVGQNLGAKKPERAAKCAWGAAGVAVAITMFIGAVLVAFPHWITGLFANSEEVHAIAADYLMILGLSQFAMAIEIVLEGAFSGAGDTVPPMLVLIPGAVARVPLAYFLCFDLNWGINGVWWTLTITSFVKAALLAVWFRRGKWQLKQV